MTHQDLITSWYTQLSETYTTEQRESWYSATAAAYNRVRPRYPAPIIDQVLALVQLPANANILELGCGPGIATTEFAKRGFSLVCLEPSQAASQLAQQNCLQYPHVNIIQSTFEAWELQPQHFHAVLAATSFHWISPEISCVKTAQSLKEKGALILLWNTPPQPSYELHQQLQEIYQIYAPDLAEYQSHAVHEQNLNQLGNRVIKSGLFQALVYRQCVSQVTYSIDDYLALLSTLSPYIKLEAQQRSALLMNLKKTLENRGDHQISLSYLSAFHLAQKV
jgi:trans-aconitate methyltransferase